MTYYFHGKGLAFTGSYSEAIDIMQEGLMVSGNNKVIRSTMLNGMSESAIFNERVDDAKNWIDESIQVSEGNNPLTYELLGDLYQLEGNIKEAIKYWEKSRDMGNDTAKIKSKIEANKS